MRPRYIDRDYRILDLLAEHRVATAEQIARVEFPNASRARERLNLLAQPDGLLARFRPYHRPGSRPFYYTVGLAGAVLLAERHGASPPRRSDITRALKQLEHGANLNHQLGVVDFFTALHAAARRTPGAKLAEWWSAATTAAECYGIVRPDGYGRWTEHAPDRRHDVQFLYEHDRGTEPLKTLIGKIDKYAILAAQHDINLPVLIELPTHARESNFHQRLTGRYGARGHRTVFVATTSTTHLRTSANNPAGSVWWLTGTSSTTRYPLAALPASHKVRRCQS